MRQWLAVAVISLCRCSSPRASDPPEPDSPVLPSDQDGDGVADDVDICPAVADPAQVDPDGDGVGWMCDPVESVQLPTPTPISKISTAIHGDTFAGSLQLQCAQIPCSYSFAAIDPQGAAVASSDSTDPADSWISAPIRLGGPLITREGRVLVSRGFLEGDTGEFDPAQRNYTVRANGAIDRTITRGEELFAFSVRTASSDLNANLLEPRANGELVAIANSEEGFLASDSLQGLMRGVGNAALVPIRHSSTQFDVKLFTVGADALSELAIPIAGSSTVEGLGRPVVFGYSASTATGSTYAEVASTGVVTGNLPFLANRILEDGPEGRPVIRETSFVFGIHGAGQHGGAFVRGGTVHPLFSSETHIPRRMVGDSTIAVLGQTGARESRVWQIDPDSTTRVIASGLFRADVSVSGDVVHVAGIRSNGDAVVIRSRPGVAALEIPFASNVSTSVSAPVRVVTTVEGAALVDLEGTTRIVASGSTTPIVTNVVANVTGGARGGNTLVVSHASSGEAAFLYEEVNGSPVLSRLSPNVPQIVDTFLDPPAPLPRGEWFKLSMNSGCQLNRIETVNGTKQLVSYGLCPQEIAGVLPGGTQVTSGAVHLLDAAGATAIVVGAQVVVDSTVSPPVVVGWVGKDLLGGYTCLAADPNRCWGVPATANLLLATADASTGRLSSIWMDGTSTNARFHIVRSIGAGDRPKP
jgi:hypothetical protein